VKSLPADLAKIISLLGGSVNGVCINDMVGLGVIACVGGCVGMDVTVGKGLTVVQLAIRNPIKRMIILKFTD
jgi:hypothetical protein